MAGSAHCSSHSWSHRSCSTRASTPGNSEYSFLNFAAISYLLSGISRSNYSAGCRSATANAISQISWVQCFHGHSGSSSRTRSFSAAEWRTDRAYWTTAMWKQQQTGRWQISRHFSNFDELSPKVKKEWMLMREFGSGNSIKYLHFWEFVDLVNSFPNRAHDFAASQSDWPAGTSFLINHLCDLRTFAYYYG